MIFGAGITRLDACLQSRQSFILETLESSSFSLLFRPTQADLSILDCANNALCQCTACVLRKLFVLTAILPCSTINVLHCRVVEYAVDSQNLNLSAIRTIRVLRPLRAINRIPSESLRAFCFIV